MKLFSISFTLIAFLVTTTRLHAQNTEHGQISLSPDGIQFFHGDLEELKAEAKTKKKIIFIDAFTEWCGPCKMMSSQTFTDKAVGDFFNANFINYKLDMEKGEGPGFAVRYDVSAYPTLLFLNPKGELVHKVLGFRKPDQLLEDARKAVNPKDNMALMKSEFENGNKDPELLLNYAKRLAESKMEYKEVAERYFEAQQEKDLLSPRNWEAIQLLTDSIQSREFQFLLRKKADFVKKYTLKQVDTKITKVCYNIAEIAIKTKNQAKFQEAVSIARKYIADNEKTAEELTLQKLETEENWDLYATQTIAYIDKFKPTNANYLNTAAWIFYEHITATESLTKALAWAKQSVAIENAYYNNDTVAALLFKLKRYDEALKYANKAVHIAEENGETAEDTETLIRKIEAEMEALPK